MDQLTFVSALVMQGFTLDISAINYQILTKGKGNGFNRAPSFIKVIISSWAPHSPNHSLIEVKSDILDWAVYHNFKRAYKYITSNKDKDKHE